MVEGAPVRVQAEKMAAGGDAIARLDDGRVVFVDGALPGELVDARLVQVRKDFARATVAEVVEPSPNRIAPPCPELARGCGGCGWQHVDPVAQLGLKADVVREALARTARMPEAEVRAGSAVGPWAYRTTLRLAVDRDGRAALRTAASHRLVTLDGCMVAHPALAALLPAMRVRGASEVTLRVNGDGTEATAMADRAGARVGGVPPHVAVGPDAVLHETVAGVRLRVSAASFFQSGPQAAALLVETVRDALGPLVPGETMLDAYGGAGLFGATVADGPVLLVESSPSACEDAAHNLAGRVEVVRSRFEQWTPRPVRVAVADPARAGLGKEGAAVLAATGAERVVLVSCDPVAMARDVALLAGHGYRHGGSTVLDLFPHTPHVEVVTVLDR